MDEVCALPVPAQPHRRYISGAQAVQRRYSSGMQAAHRQSKSAHESPRPRSFFTSPRCFNYASSTDLCLQLLSNLPRDTAAYAHMPPLSIVWTDYHDKQQQHPVRGSHATHLIMPSPCSVSTMSCGRTMVASDSSCQHVRACTGVHGFRLQGPVDKQSSQRGDQPSSLAQHLHSLRLRNR